MHPSFNKRQILHWCERVSHIMGLEPDINPMAFPILPLLQGTKSLAHVLASVCAAHERFFSPTPKFFEEQSLALELIQSELSTMQNDQLIPRFLSVYMLGLLAAWVDGYTSDFGRDHLFGARAIIDMLVSGSLDEADELTSFVVGAYVFWDMSCSFLLEPGDQMPINTPEMYAAINAVGKKFHPIVGHSMDMFYVLGTLGRYCRQVVELGIRDTALELTLEEQLLQWAPIGEGKEMALLCDSYRLHGLLNLYRTCGNLTDQQDDSNLAAFSQSGESLNTRVRLYALRIVSNLMSIPTTSTYINTQAIPLLTAGAELTAEDVTGRNDVTQRLRSIYSFNRLPHNLMVIELLQEVWIWNDAGVSISWLEMMLLKGWRLMLG